MSVASVAKKTITGTSFGARLRCARENAGMTQEQLAERAGVHRVDVSRYENDKIVPSLEAAWALADALGVKLEELRGARG